MIWITKTLKRTLAISIAFIIFGIMDNGIMIVAGSAIDGTIGVLLGVSALFSAGIGNALSDAIGISCGRSIEGWLEKRFPSIQESKTTSSKFQIITAEVCGIILGCLIGMIPLLWI